MKSVDCPDNWQQLEFGALVKDMGDGGTPPRNKPEYFNGNINWCTVTDIQRFISDTEEKLSALGLRNSSAKLWPENSIILSTGATIGRVGIAQVRTATKQGITGIVLKEDKVDANYIYYLLNSLTNLLNRYSQGSTFREIRPPLLSRISVLVPPLPEQHKIAETLSMVDETIEKTDAIIRGTRQLNKGLIQRLFTEGIGHTKLKETNIGRMPEDWEIVNLGSMITVLTDYHANGSYESLKANVTLLSDPDYAIMVRTVNFEQNDWENLKYISEHAYNYLEKSKVHSNDLVMNKIANPGRVFFVPNVDMPMSLGMNLFLIRMKEDLALNKFYYYYLRYREGYVKRFTAGSTTETITKEAVRRLKVVAPRLSEQQQIVQILSEVDAKIETEQAYMAELEQLKKGLMQVLLTGKVRVKV